MGVLGMLDVLVSPLPDKGAHYAAMLIGDYLEKKGTLAPTNC